MVEIQNTELHRIALTVIIYRPDGRFLITRRSLEKKAYPGKWTVPGGGLETEDYVHTPPTHADGQWYGALEKTMRREVREEVNLDIGKPEYLLDLTFIRPDGIPILVLSFFAPYVSGDVVMDADSIEFAWVTPEEAKQYDLIAGILEEIQEVDALLHARTQ